MWYFFRFIFVVFAFIVIGQYLDRKRSGRERWDGIYKPDLEFGMPEVQR